MKLIETRRYQNGGGKKTDMTKRKLPRETRNGLADPIISRGTDVSFPSFAPVVDDGSVVFHYMSAMLVSFSFSLSCLKPFLSSIPLPSIPPSLLPFLPFLLSSLLAFLSLLASQLLLASPSSVVLASELLFIFNRGVPPGVLLPLKGGITLLPTCGAACYGYVAGAFEVFVHFFTDEIVV